MRRQESRKTQGRLSKLKVSLSLSSIAAGLALLIYSQVPLQIGYAVITAAGGLGIPVSTALFSSRDRTGELLWEAGVAAVKPLRQGRIFIDQRGLTRTALALVNPSQRLVGMRLTLRDSAGAVVEEAAEDLGPGQHRALYADELFLGLEDFRGSLTFEADGSEGLAAVTLRQNSNRFGEAIFATLPVVDISEEGGRDSVIFPQVGAGEGLSTQIILINGSSKEVRGTIRLFDGGGLPLELEMGGVLGSEFSYQLEREGTYQGDLGLTSGVGVGYAVVELEQGDRTPSGVAIFRFTSGGLLISEAGVLAAPLTRAARIFVDQGGTRTGVAVANPGRTAEVSFELLDSRGESLQKRSWGIAPGGHLAKFVDELFPELAAGFTGLMEITSPGPVAPVTLKLTTNGRGHSILSTLPVADLERPQQAELLVLPQIGFGDFAGGTFATQLILINSDKTSGTSGTLEFFQSEGTPLEVTVGGEMTSELAYALAAGEARQVRPGEGRGRAAEIIVDPANWRSREVVVNEGNSIQLSPLVLDEEGRAMEVALSYSSLSPEVATVDTGGRVRGAEAGFSTLVVRADEAVATATIVVVKLTSGVGGFGVTGVAQDLARRLYLANTVDHTILLAQDLESEPLLYAGVEQQPGLKNDQRLKSLFDNPAYLAFDQSRGNLYVSDRANHVIRLVKPGADGGVQTLAGTGQSGAGDGSLSEAAFRDPQGIALDHRGGLWVADSGNHAVRRIDLAAGTVATVAGVAGSPGWVDGLGREARFNSPVGIAVQPESLAQQLERERRGEPPGPVSLIVADSGNGVLRRVTETGEVQTIGSKVGATLAKKGAAFAVEQASQPLVFSQPVGVAADPFGTIYVTEPGSGEVWSILENGGVIRVAEEGTFALPGGVVITQRGKVLVADGSQGALEVTYGEPVISTVTPSRISNQGGDAVTVRGSNFAPDTLVVLGTALIAGVQVQDTQTISFVAPSLPSGLSTLSVQNRAGIAQTLLLLDAAPLSQLAPGEITTLAGGASFAGDGSEATSASVLFPVDVVVDSAGNIFIADSEAERIRRVDAVTKIITTVAGTGLRGFSGDDGPAIGAALAEPSGLAMTPDGDLLICDGTNGRIRRVDIATGLITTVAGGGEPSDGLGDGGPATLAHFFDPAGIASNAAGDLFVADTIHHRVRKIDAATETVMTVAGTGRAGFSGDGAAATEAALNEPTGIAVDAAGDLFVADNRNLRVRQIDSETGVITTLAGGGSIFQDNVLATETTLEPFGVAIDAGGNLLIADLANDRVRGVDLLSGIITTVAGSGSTGFLGDGGHATAADLRFVHGVTVDAAGNLLIADSGNGRVREVSALTGTITTVAGNGEERFSGENRPALEARMAAPEAVAWLSDGSFLIADTDNGRIRKVDAVSGVITTFAGSGEETFSGEGGPATEASFVGPTDVALDSFGNVFLPASGNSLVLRVDAAGILTVVAGNREEGFSGDGGAATSAALNFPMGIAVDAEGNLFIADTFNSRIRKVNNSTGLITTVAGDGQMGFGGDGGQARAASLSEPARVAVDAGGRLFISDTGNHRIRQVNLSTGIITTVAGDGQAGFSGDGGLAAFASLDSPRGLVVDGEGDLLIADVGNGRIRRLDIATGIITTVAGGEEHDFSGDNGPALGASLNFPRGVSIDLTTGDLLIADTYNHRIRAVRGPAY